MRPRNGRGRPASIPETAYGEILRLLSLGHGYRAVANELAERGICFCTKSSIERIIKGQGVYQARRVLVAANPEPHRDNMANQHSKMKQPVNTPA